jgi:NitT/TauT family transport system permease protein
VVPQLLPYIMAAARYGLGIIWKITVLVELLGLSSGVGYMLHYWFQLNNMAQVFAWTVFFTIVMLFLELGVLKRVERHLFAWRPEARV